MSAKSLISSVVFRGVAVAPARLVLAVLLLLPPVVEAGSGSHRPGDSDEASLKSPRVSSEIATSVLPDSTLFGVGTATVDGILSPGEWDAAGSIDLVINLPGGGTEAATLFVMNDATDLYLALRFARSVVDPGNSLVLEFDNNDDGVAANGDDVIVFNPAVGFFDEFRTNEPPCPPGSPEAACGLADVTDGGQNDGAGAFSNDGTFSVYELRHTLKSGDLGHDFALDGNQTVGFFLFLRMIRAPGSYPGDFGDTDFPGFRNYAHIRVSPNRRPHHPHKTEEQR